MCFFFMDQVRYLVELVANAFLDELQCSVMKSLLQDTGDNYLLMQTDEEIAKRLNVDDQTIRYTLCELKHQGLIYEFVVKDIFLFSIHPNFNYIIKEKCLAMKALDGRKHLKCQNCCRQIAHDAFVKNFFMCVCKSTHVTEEKIELADETRTILNILLREVWEHTVEIRMLPVRTRTKDKQEDANQVFGQ